MATIINRILIFGAGVIGSAYALKFIEAGIDVTMFARSARLKSLQENGLQYNEKGVNKTVPVNVIGILEDDDIYDFVLVPVRYDQATSALLALKDNKSKIIVTMTNNSSGFSAWKEILGDRLLPAFPGFGGQMKNGVLFARFPPKAIAVTRFGEISGIESERTRAFAELLKSANLGYKIDNNMFAFLIAHSVSDIAMTGVLVQEDKVIDEKTLTSKETAHKITTTLKKYIPALQEAGVTITPSFFKTLIKFPDSILDFLFRKWLRSDMVRSMLAPDYAGSAHRENEALEKDLLTFLAQK